MTEGIHAQRSRLARASFVQGVLALRMRMLSGTQGVTSALCLLLAVVGTSRAGTPPGNTQAPVPLPQDVVTAWKTGGAEVGWLRSQAWSYNYLASCAGGYSHER